MCQNIFTTNNEDQEGQYKQTYECNNNFLSKMKIVICERERKRYLLHTLL